MIVTLLALLALLLALVPALLFWANLRLYRPPPPPASSDPLPAVSLLIPARNEARSIAAAVEAAWKSRDVILEIVVLDDHSSDDTGAIITALAVRDPRIRPLQAPELPPGWCGKQHACAVLARAAQHPLLVFVDADVRLTPEGLARAAAFLQSSGAELVSGIPRQETGTLLEKLVLPLIHFLLLGFLPLARMRRGSHPAYGAGCGQLFLTRRSAYETMGGHQTIRASLHDGLTLPRAFRKAGLRTDLFDATDVAVCRMYRGAGELWRGLAKNAREGLAAPGMIVPATLLLAGGQIMPFALLALLPLVGITSPWTWSATLLAVLAAYAPRFAALHRFHQSPLGALLHPLGVLLLLLIQWTAWVQALGGRPARWKERDYPNVAGKLEIPAGRSL